MRQKHDVRSRVSDVLPAPSRFDKADIACLTAGEILGMSRRRLIESLHAAALPIREGLKLADAAVLRCMLFEARRCCRNQGY